MKISKEIKDKWYKDDHIILTETKSNKVDKLFKLYAKNKYTARVVYMNDASNYENFRTVLFTKANGDFNIVVFRKKYGISKSNIIYNHEKRMLDVIYKGGKFYLVDNTNRRAGIITLTLNTLFSACSRVNVRNNIDNKLLNVITGLLEHRFSWIRFLNENHLCYNTAFNTIVSKKLYNQKKALTHQYKTNYPVAKILDKVYKSGNTHGHQLIKVLSTYMPYIINIESLQEDWFKGQNVGMFHDSLKMAKTLDKRVNASWTVRRLKEEHDKWAKVISDIVFIDGNRDMNINKVYKDFSEHSGYNLISTTRDMAYEGKRQNHCVVSYVNSVENGSCAIVTNKDYTIELRTRYFNSTPIIDVTQVKGYSNSEPTEVFRKQLDDKVVAYNKSITDGKFTEDDLNKHGLLSGFLDENDIDVDLPF